MQLTKHTDYAFRVLIYLASIREGDLATVQEIAAKFDISRSHVMKVVQKLASAGLIQSSRGQKGGVKLGRPKETIHLRAVIELMEATLEPVNCNEPVCLIKKKCTLKNILFQAQQQFLEHVEQYTLADVAEPAVSIIGLLQRGKRND
jgi:Rrf2 family transcriptional regulator, nitric oxide-sensitive transcriptional repressor